MESDKKKERRAKRIITRNVVCRDFAASDIAANSFI